MSETEFIRSGDGECNDALFRGKLWINRPIVALFLRKWHAIRGHPSRDTIHFESHGIRQCLTCGAEWTLGDYY